MKNLFKIGGLGLNRRLQYGWRWLGLLGISALLALFSAGLGSDRSVAQRLPGLRPPTSITTSYCHVMDSAVAEKNSLRDAAFQGNTTAQYQYWDTVQAHARAVADCRRRTWPRHQAIWVRLYPCDAQPGQLERLLDEMVDFGYDQVYVESFSNGQVLLPQADNDTPWPSVLRQPGYENRDLLAEAIAKGHDRGLSVHAWMFSMNVGRVYANRRDRQSAMAQNGYGQTSLSMYEAASLDPNRTFTPPDEAFVDPYNRQAKLDFYHLTQKILSRQPDGVLFDYIRYPVGLGENLVANHVQDLWIYGESAQQALLERATNPSGRQLIQQFLQNGQLTDAAVAALTEDPLWQGRTPSPEDTDSPVTERRQQLQQELWTLAVDHASQGVLDFLNVAKMAADQHNIAAGAVFFPEGNRTMRDGFDSRLQPWDRFPATLSWHPMSYGVCGQASCITAKVQTVLDQAENPKSVKPVLAGRWGQAMSNRPSLEVQMQDIRRAAPTIDTISHFAYSWQRPQRTQERQFCRI